MKLRVLDLFSGIGGFALGLERAGGFEAVAFSEIERFPSRVLAKHWPEVPNLGDIRNLKGGEIVERFGQIDLVCGGFPCQPWSSAGKQRGRRDHRDLWPEMFRLISEIEPRWVLGENVRGFVSNPLGLDSLLFDLETRSYEARAFIVPALGQDAQHKRDRVWVVANRDDNARQAVRGQLEIAARQIAGRGDNRSRSSGDAGRQEPARGAREIASTASAGANAQSQRRTQRGENCRRSPQRPAGVCSTPNTDSQRPSHRHQSLGEKVEGFERLNWWPAEPGVGRVANGVPRRVDRLKGLGNAVVPQIVERFGMAILAAEGTA